MTGKRENNKARRTDRPNKDANVRAEVIKDLDVPKDAAEALKGGRSISPMCTTPAR